MFRLKSEDAHWPFGQKKSTSRMKRIDQINRNSCRFIIKTSNTSLKLLRNFRGCCAAPNLGKKGQSVTYQMKSFKNRPTRNIYKLTAPILQQILLKILLTFLCSFKSFQGGYEHKQFHAAIGSNLTRR